MRYKELLSFGMLRHTAISFYHQLQIPARRNFYRPFGPSPKLIVSSDEVYILILYFTIRSLPPLTRVIFIRMHGNPIPRLLPDYLSSIFSSRSDKLNTLYTCRYW